MMEAASICRTSVQFYHQNTRHYNSEQSHVHTCYCADPFHLKSAVTGCFTISLAIISVDSEQCLASEYRIQKCFIFSPTVEVAKCTETNKYSGKFTVLHKHFLALFLPLRKRYFQTLLSVATHSAT